MCKRRMSSVPRTIKRCPWDEIYGCKYRDEGCEEEMCETIKEIKTPRYFVELLDNGEMKIHSSEKNKSAHNKRGNV